MRNTIIIITITLTALVLSLSCGRGSRNEGNPTIPEFPSVNRAALAFEEPVQIFGPDPRSADVDLASVVWGTESTYPGDMVVFQDNSTWALAVAIEQRDGGPGTPYIPPSYPVLRFIPGDLDNYQMSDVFDVLVYPLHWPYVGEEFQCL